MGGCVGGSNRNNNNDAPPPQQNRQRDQNNLAPPEQPREEAKAEPGSVSVIKHSNRFTEEEVEEKRQAMKQSLEEGHSKPPTVNYPHLEPISAIGQ